VGLEAENDRVLTREQVVELADAVAASSGIATGIGTNRYGARLVVQAGSRDEAIEKATGEFVRAAARAGLPQRPVVRVEAVSEDQAAALDEDGPVVLSEDRLSEDRLSEDRLPGDRDRGGAG
jgi:hypothetical protein